MFSLLLVVSGTALGSQDAAPDSWAVDLLPGRGEAHVVFLPADGGPAAERTFLSRDQGRDLRIEPGNSYLLPESLWDRFAGSRHGPFRIRVSSRDDEAVLASGRLVGRAPSEPGFLVSTFEGEETDRGIGLFVLVQQRRRDGGFPDSPPWAGEALPAVLAAQSRLFGPLPTSPPQVVVLDFPSPIAKAFPSALLLDRRVAGGEAAPPSGRLAVLAHEAAHLWWGNSVSMTGPGAATLQEGLAELGSCRAVGALLGPEAERARWAALRDEYLLASAATVEAHATLVDEGPPGAYGRALRYARSALVLRMLEARVGPEAFSRALSAIAAARRSIGWQDLVGAASTEARVDLADFEAGWVRGSGHPDPQLAVDAVTGEWSVRNFGSGAGEFPIAERCGSKESQPELFLNLAPGESRVIRGRVPPGCEIVAGLREVWLTGPPGPAAAPGLTLGRAWGHPVVRGVAVSSAASRAGLMAGDLLITAAGRPLDEEDAGWVLRLLAEGKDVAFRIRRGPREFDIVLPASAR